jgi:3alpha(or 20beta)-hydroxysteroid dehydrogenase
VNLKGVWLGMRYVAPVMRERGGGAIVNTSSIAGLHGSPNLIAYSTSKHAVIGLTRTAALELFLCSSDASFISGGIHPIDGARTA